MILHRCFICAAFLATILSAQFMVAEELPAYQELDTNAPVPRRLRTEPQLLSRFPTTFSLAFLADSKLMRTVDIDGRVWQWPVDGSSEAELLTETNSEPACAVLSGDARLLAFAEPDGSVVLMDLDSKQIEFRDSTSEERTVTLRFSPSSKRFVGVTVAGEVRVWDTNSGKLIHQFRADPSPMQTLAFSPDGRTLALASYSRDVKLYDLGIHSSPRAPSAPRSISMDSSRITALDFAPNGEQLVVAAADGTASVIDLTNQREAIALGTHPFAIWSIAFEPGGRRMATGSWDGTIKLWATDSWDELQSVKTHEESVAKIAFDGQEGLISAGLDGRLLHWLPEVAGIGPAAMIAGRTAPVWVAIYSPDGKTLFVGGNEKRFELWEVASQKLVISREGHPTTRCAAFSPDGKTLATGGDNGKIYLHNANNGTTRETQLLHPGAVSAIVFTKDGQTLVSVCDGGVVKVWDPASGEEKATWREHKQQIYCASISPDGKWLITGGGNWTTGDPGELIVWELKTGRVHARVQGHKLAVWTIVFTPDGERFASSDSSGAVKVWNLETLEEERTLQHSMWVRPLAMSPDGTTLAVGRGDGSVRLWDTATWTQRAACDGHDSFTFWLQYAPSGNTLATSSNDGTVRFWRMER